METLQRLSGEQDTEMCSGYSHTDGRGASAPKSCDRLSN